MKFFLNILFFTATQFVIAQEIKKPTINNELRKITVEYSFNNNFLYQVFESKLTSNGRQATFQTKLSDDSDGKAELKENDIYVGGKLRDTYQVINKVIDTLVSYETINGKTIYAIKEKIPSLKWVINYEEVKKLNNFQCNKATLEFRGRKYTAWYTKEIPIFFGPWKFQGLPGLILEISDDTKTYSWVATKIDYPSKKNIKVPYIKAESVSLKEYVNLRTENLEKMRARVRSILPRGTKFSTPKNSRNGFELVYEWEVDEE